MNRNIVDHTSTASARGARSFFTVGVGQLLAQMVAVVSAAIVPRLLGPPIYGRWSAVIALIAFAAVFVQLSFGLVDGREIGPAWETARRAYALQIGSTTWVVRAALSLGFALAVAMCALASPGLEVSWTLALVLFLVAVARYGFQTNLSLFVTLGRPGTFAVLNVINSVLVLIATIVGYLLGGFFGMFVVLAAASLFSLALSAIKLQQAFPIRPRFFSWKVLRPHTNYLFWTSAGAILYSATMWLTVYVVGAFVSSSEAAFVGLQVQVLSLFSAASLGAIHGVFPILANFEAQGQIGRIREWASIIIRYGTAVSTVSIVGWTLLGEQLTLWILSPAYEPVYLGIILMATAHMFLFAGATCNAILNVRGKSKAGTANLAVYAALMAIGMCWAVSGSDDGTALRVAMIYAVSTGVFFVCAYVVLAIVANCRVGLRRTAVLMLPIALALPAAQWQASFGVRILATVAFVAFYTAFAVSLKLIPLDELREVVATVRHKSSA